MRSDGSKIPTRDAAKAALDRGIDRFNAGAWHDALDDFEVPLHAAGDPDHDLYLALVRAAASLYHLEGGRPLSARRLGRSALDLLAASPPVRAGIDVAELARGLERALAPVLLGEAAGGPAGDAPRIRRVPGGGTAP